MNTNNDYLIKRATAERLDAIHDFKQAFNECKIQPLSAELHFMIHASKHLISCNQVLLSSQSLDSKQAEALAVQSMQLIGVITHGYNALIDIERRDHKAGTNEAAEVMLIMACEIEKEDN